MWPSYGALVLWESPKELSEGGSLLLGIEQVVGAAAPVWCASPPGQKIGMVSFAACHPFGPHFKVCNICLQALLPARSPPRLLYLGYLG